MESIATSGRNGNCMWEKSDELRMCLCGDLGHKWDICGGEAWVQYS